MVSFSLAVWALIGGVAVVGLLAVLYTFAETIRCERQVHDSKIRAERLRLQYAAQLASQPRDEEVIEVDEAPSEEKEPLRKAA
jgi:hypothetical protein